MKKSSWIILVISLVISCVSTQSISSGTATDVSAFFRMMPWLTIRLPGDRFVVRQTNVQGFVTSITDKHKISHIVRLSGSYQQVEESKKKFLKHYTQGYAYTFRLKKEVFINGVKIEKCEVEANFHIRQVAFIWFNSGTRFCVLALYNSGQDWSQKRDIELVVKSANVS